MSLPKDQSGTKAKTTVMTTDLPCVPLLWISLLSELGKDPGQSVTHQKELTDDWGTQKGLGWSEPTDSRESQPRTRVENMFPGKLKNMNPTEHNSQLFLFKKMF